MILKLVFKQRYLDSNKSTLLTRLRRTCMIVLKDFIMSINSMTRIILMACCLAIGLVQVCDSQIPNIDLGGDLVPVGFESCPSGWEAFNQVDTNTTCYFFDHSAEVTFVEAGLQCVFEDLFATPTLATIHSSEEQRFLTNLMRNNIDYIIGLSRTAGANSSFVWVDGTNLDFTNWGLNQPIDNEGCVLVRNTDRKWYTYPCNTDVTGLICQQAATGGGSLPFGLALGAVIAIVVIGIIMAILVTICWCYCCYCCFCKN